MYDLIPVNSTEDIPAEYRDTPVGLLLEYHNLGRNPDDYEKASLLVGICMDNRKHLIIPDNFAYIIRTGGANLRYSEFKVSYAISIGHVRHIALIGHNNCGMVNLVSKEADFVDGLVNTGWDRELAQEHFMSFAPMFEIGNEKDFIIGEARRLRLKYPGVLIAPMFYLVEDNRLYFIADEL